MKLSGLSIFGEYTKKNFTAKFVVSCCAFCKLRRKFWFFCSVNHLSGPLRKHMFTWDWCIFIHFFGFCVSRLVAFDRPVSGKIFLIFLILFFCKKKAMSASCPRQKFHSSSLFLSSLESFSVLSLWAKLGERVALWFPLTPPTQLKWLTEQENLFEVWYWIRL